MALISINSMVIKALIGRHECRSSCQFGRGSSGKRAINQSINQTNQSMHYFAIVKHASIQNAHVACCMLHVAFMSFLTLQQPQLAANLQPAQGREKELKRSWMGSERGGGAGFSIGHIDALHATTNNVQRFRCKVASYDAWHRNCFVASSASPPSPCPCLTVSSLFVLLANFGKILQLLRLRQLQS